MPPSLKNNCTVWAYNLPTKKKIALGYVLTGSVVVGGGGGVSWENITHYISPFFFLFAPLKSHLARSLPAPHFFFLIKRSTDRIYFFLEDDFSMRRRKISGLT